MPLLPLEYVRHMLDEVSEGLPENNLQYPHQLDLLHILPALKQSIIVPMTSAGIEEILEEIKALSLGDQRALREALDNST